MKCTMKAIDRVMKAYGRTHQLTEAQAVMVRKELSVFIEELLAEKNSDDRNGSLRPRQTNA